MRLEEGEKIMRAGKRKWRLMKKQVARQTTITEGKTEEEERQL